MQQVQFVTANGCTGKVGVVLEDQAAQRVVGIRLGGHAQGGAALLTKIPVGATRQLQKVIADRDDLIHKPGEFDLAFDHRFVAVGRIDREQFLSGDGHDKILILGGAARLQCMLNDTAFFQRLFVKVYDLHLFGVASSFVALVRHEDQPGVRQHGERLLVVLCFTPRPAVAHRHLVKQPRLGHVAHVEQRHGHPALVVRVIHADRNQPIAQRLNVGRPARHLEFALDYRLARVGQVDDPERVDSLVGHDVNPVGIEARGKQPLALGQAQLAKRLRFIRVGQAESLERGFPPRAVVVSVAVESLGDDRECALGQAHLELVRHPAGGADGGRLIHRAVRRGDVDAAQVCFVILFWHRRGDEEKLVRSVNVIIVAIVKQRVAGAWLRRVFHVERGDLGAMFPAH